MQMLSYELATARTWAEIDVDDILFNYRNALKELAPGVKHFTVLKANAYGLGAAPIAKILYGEGARLFAVACVREAVELANVLEKDADILIMGETMPEEMELSLTKGILSTVFTYDTARRLSETASRLGVTARIHCKVDTGLNRLGFSMDEAADEIERIVKLKNLSFEGLFSHLQRRSPEHDRLQAERILKAQADLKARGVLVPMLHLLDSIGMWRYPENQFDAVRDAAFIMGHTPEEYPRPENIRFAMSLKTHIVRVFTAKAGECLGYDASHPLEKDTRVATLCVGYADGYPRAMSYCGQVEVREKRAKVLGVVCMDLMMVDVTDIPEAKVGDIVTLMGGNIGIHEYAGFSNGYCNEYMAMVSRRVPRVYLKGGQVIDIAAYMEGD